MWLDDLQLYLLSDYGDSVLLFDHTSGASLAPPATADSATRSKWLPRDVAARLAICNHLPLAERAHFGRHKTAKALYDAVVARYSSPATAALGHLIMPYLFPELSAFATVEDLVTHLCTSNTRYRAALPAKFLDRNPPLPLMYITLYFIVTHLHDSLRAVKDHFLALDPTKITVDLLEKHLVAAETSVVAVGAARGTPRTPFFEGCSASPLAPFGSLSGLHLPSFSTNLVSASSPVAAPCSCHILSHQTLLSHHRLGHPSLPRLRGMHSCLLVSGLPRSLPPLPPSPAPPCLPCVDERQRAGPHSSSFPPTTAPLQTLSNLYLAYIV
ncbi:unnamed protein product [Closterium sp. NIES-53]